MLVTMVLKRGSLVQWFGMLQLVERRMVTAKSAASNDSLPNHIRAGFPGQALILIFLSLCWRVGRLDRSSWHHSLADCRFGPLEGVSRRTWFNVEAEDYLERRTHPVGLRVLHSEYLRSQGVRLEQYSHTILVTAPRFLGFSFNPVSFWYLYNEANLLEAMVVEVNNTFDERRMYFMERKVGGGQASEESTRNFKYSRQKDFHVSPFNSRDDSYTLQATDPYADGDAGNFQIDCNTVLKTADQKDKTVARVFSTGSALDAMSMTRWQTLAFVFHWLWVGLMASPRILHEARIL